MPPPLFPSLYQINTRIHLNERSRQLGRPATLDDVPDELLDQVAQLGFGWLWWLGVWQTGVTGRDVSRHNPDWRKDYLKQLPDLTEDDICGSPFAVQSYAAHVDLGGREALVRLRERMAKRDLKLLLDFVPNHTAPDHPWRFARPEFYIHGTDESLLREPHNYVRVNTKHGPRVLAHGRDPYFPGWPDTLQLNYRHAGLRAAMTETLVQIADLCDGVRCDMAMLVLPDVFARTWGASSWPTDQSQPVDTPFWPEAIAQVRRAERDFLFMAEVYWDMEWVLQEQGFDFTYDKRLYDRLHDQRAEPVRKHLWAGADFQRRSVRFLENHDEPRAAATFPWPIHQAAAVLTFLLQGMRFFHEGQLEGRKFRPSMHLCRRQNENADAEVRNFYGQLLEVLKRPELRQGRWQLHDCRPAWGDNSTWDQFLVFSWALDNQPRLLTVVNYGDRPGQAYVNLPLNELRGKKYELRDLLGTARYERDGDGMVTSGLYVDMPPWGYHVFELTAV